MQRRTTIIAEIGENHLGDFEIARRMIEEAACHGADIVKFQSYLPSQLPSDDPEIDWVRKVYLPDDAHFEMKALAEERGVEFMSSPFTPERAKFLCEKLECRSIKIASGLIANPTSAV